MDEIAKFLNKIPKRDRIALGLVIMKLHLYVFEGLDIKKLTGYKDMYRVRIGRYRIIYRDYGDRVTLRAIRKRDESTYDDL